MIPNFDSADILTRNRKEWGFGFRQYDFPFQLVLPVQLLPQACTYILTNDAIHRSRILLHPISGNSMLTSRE
ncbi:hypothetical protein N7510_002618 [Penicillium lagena]|uniref:uncharacterized protein n=1 Tax=Penicillium lagena TaxID=94218 RepID=UPI002541E2E1|nr:uncharacterized protein N7510_002618 [Penicillium lagena]KAJ5626309.1 hypothetical protein N7510_002618 [Penicillium lagena]